MLTVGYRTVSATLILFSYNPTAAKRSTQQYRFTSVASVAQYGTKNRIRKCKHLQNHIDNPFPLFYNMLISCSRYLIPEGVVVDVGYIGDFSLAEYRA